MNALSQFLTKRSFEDSIFNGKITISEADEKRIDLSENILDFNKKAGLRTKKAIYEGRESTINVFKSGIKQTQGKGTKILTPKQIIQRLPIAIIQLKSGNTSESLLQEICQPIYFSHRAKEITKNFVQYNEFSNGIAQNGYYI